jgi:hypothetical protein
LLYEGSTYVCTFQGILDFGEGACVDLRCTIVRLCLEFQTGRSAIVEDCDGTDLKGTISVVTLAFSWVIYNTSPILGPKRYKKNEHPVRRGGEIEAT